MVKMTSVMNHTEGHAGMENMIFGTCCLFTSVLVIFTNAIVIIVILQSRELHLPTLYIVAFMAVFDFLLGVYTLVFAVPGFFLDAIAYTWMPMVVIACLHGFLIAQAMMNTAMTVFDRFVAIKFPLRYSGMATKRNLMIMSMVSLLLNFGKAVLQYYIQPSETFNPFTVWVEIEFTSNWFAFFSLQFVIIPFIVITVCSLAILIEIRKGKKRIVPNQIKSVAEAVSEEGTSIELVKMVHNREKTASGIAPRGGLRAGIRLDRTRTARTGIQWTDSSRAKQWKGSKETLKLDTRRPPCGEGTQWTRWADSRAKAWEAPQETTQRDTSPSPRAGARWTQWSFSRPDAWERTDEISKLAAGSTSEDKEEDAIGSTKWADLRKNRARHVREFKCTLMVMVYIGSFYISFFPGCVLLIWAYVVGNENVPHIVRSMAAMALFCSSFFNVFIYTGTYQPFRDAVIYMFCKAYYRRKQQKAMLENLKD